MDLCPKLTFQILIEFAMHSPEYSGQMEESLLEKSIKELSKVNPRLNDGEQRRPYS